MCLLDIDALKFCPFSELGVNYNYNTGRDDELLVAVPNLVESCWVWDSCSSPAARGPAMLTLKTERQMFGSFQLVNVSITATIGKGGRRWVHSPAGYMYGSDPVVHRNYYVSASPLDALSTATGLRILTAYEAGNVECGKWDTAQINGLHDETRSRGTLLVT